MTSTPASVDDPLMIFAEFLSLLSHEMRGPISTLANDLEYFSSKSPGDSTESWRSALNDVRELLDGLSLTTRSGNKLATVEVRDTPGGIAIPAPLAAALKSFTMLPQATGLGLDRTANSLVLLLPCNPAESKNNHQGFSLQQFSLKPGHTDLTLALAETVLRVYGATISQDDSGVSITVPLAYGKSETTDR